MKKISVLALIFLALLSCKEGEENVDQENKAEKNPVEQTNENQEQDSEEASEEDLGYSLGVRPDNAIPNQFGDDSIDAEGNVVYPARDTIWDEE